MFSSSETTEKLDRALAKAQGEIETAIKDKNNPAYRSKYADLSSVWDACRAALSKYEISVTQWPIHSDDNRMHLVTRVAHAGEWFRAEFSIPVLKQDAHGWGSATTYAKRFALAAAIGITADDENDDDGNEACGKEKPLVKHSKDCAHADAPPPAALVAPITADKPVKAIAVGAKQKARKDELEALMARRDWTKDEVVLYCKQAYTQDNPLALADLSYETLVKTIQTKSPPEAFLSLEDSEIFK